MRITDHVQGNRLSRAGNLSPAFDQQLPDPTTPRVRVDKQCSQFALSIGLDSTVANPTMAPFHSATNTLPATICPRGTSIASGWASKASRSPALVRDARSCNPSSSSCSEVTAGRIRKFSITHAAYSDLSLQGISFTVSSNEAQPILI